METVKFGDLYLVPTCNGLTRPSSVRGQGYKMINMGELFSHDIIREYVKMERVQMSEKEQEKFSLKKYDLLFARQSLVASGAGKCSIIKELNEITTFESHLIRVRLDKSIANPVYYYYLFQLPYNPVKTIINQCPQARIRGSELCNIKVPKPSLTIQNKIANILSTYDDLIENNNKRIKLLEQMAEDLYKEWFVRFRFPGYENAEFENGIPKDWNIKSISEIAEINAGGDAPKEFSLEKTKEYSIPIYSNGIKDDGLYGYSNKATIKDNGITISARGTVGFVCLRDEPYLPIVRLISVHSLEIPLSINWLFLLLKNDIIEGYGTSQQQITVPYFKRKKILVPTEELICNFYEITKPIFSEKKKLKIINTNLIKQRDLLLPRLMSGKLEVE